MREVPARAEGRCSWAGVWVWPGSVAEAVGTGQTALAAQRRQAVPSRDLGGFPSSLSGWGGGGLGGSISGLHFTPFPPGPPEAAALSFGAGKKGERERPNTRGMRASHGHTAHLPTQTRVHTQRHVDMGTHWRTRRHTCVHAPHTCMCTLAFTCPQAHTHTQGTRAHA